MASQSQVLAIIPARGGSKGIPRKNLFPVAGEPLVALSIKEAMKSKKITDLILSTDDDEIAEVGRSLGVRVPFIRPRHLSED